MSPSGERDFILFAVLIGSVVMIVSYSPTQGGYFWAAGGGIVPGAGEPQNIINVNGFISSDNLTQKQIDFANEHYDFLAIANPKTYQGQFHKPLTMVYQNLLEYSNHFGFDFQKVYSHEDMFAHNNTSPYMNRRLPSTEMDVWMMNRSDFLDPADPDATNHWVNYFAEVANMTVQDYALDGAYVDMANNKINEDNFNGLLPDDYSKETFSLRTEEAIMNLKNVLGEDKMAFFNGVGWMDGENETLEHADGGLWETWLFWATNNKYFGEDNWKRSIDFVEMHKGSKKISLASKKPGLSNEADNRSFIISSFLLVAGENVYLTMVDFNLNKNGEMQFYPEYDVRTGRPLGSYYLDDGLYRRDFENGFVLVNPNKRHSYDHVLTSSHYVVVPVGGGMVGPNGHWSGSLKYYQVSGTITLDPVKGAVFLKAV